MASDEEYVSVAVETEPDDYANEAYDFLQTVWPEWEPNEANLEVAILEAISRIASELSRLAADVPAAIFRWYGASIVGLPPLEGAAASTATTWTMIGTDGYTIPQGTLVGVRASGDELQPFQVAEEVVVPPGQSATAAGEVVITALEEGAEASNLGDIGANVELIDNLDYVSGIVMTGPTGGGVDPEEDAAYLNRLRSRLLLLTPRPILPRDFAILARDVPGVARATAIDLYKPGPPWDPNPADPAAERTVTVVPIDESGLAVGAEIRDAVDALLQEEREVNFKVYVIDPTYNVVDVNVTVKKNEGQEDADLQARVEASIEEYLNPAMWGLPNEGDPGTSAGWDNVTVLRRYELAEAILRTDGADYIDAGDLEFQVAGGGFSEADKNLTGVAPLPTAGAINVTVV